MKWIVMIVLCGCARDPLDLYPFPSAQDNLCPMLDELPGLRPDPALGCVVPCKQVSDDGCLLNDDTMFGEAPLRCIGSAVRDGDAPVCVRTCSVDADCGPAFHCAPAARPSGLTICRLP